MSAGSVLLALAFASPAAADTVTCSYTPSGGIFPAFVTMGITPHNGLATFMERAGNDLVAQGDNVADCGVATVTNTDIIAVHDDSPNGAGDLGIFYVPVGGAPLFAPGATNEPGNSDEIEFGIDLGGGRDTLGLAALYGAGGPIKIRLGADGSTNHANLNAGEVSGVDSDLSFKGVDNVYFAGGFAGDEGSDVRATGGGGTGDSSLPVRTMMDGGAGDDLFEGGSVHDAINGLGGDDILTGNRGTDFLDGRGGDDLLRGGAGGDDLIAGIGADELSGGPRADRLDGGSGADLVLGGAGKDGLKGKAGKDTVKGGPGADKLGGGPGRDRLVGGGGFDVCAGGPGRDVLIGCEISRS